MQSTLHEALYGWLHQTGGSSERCPDAQAFPQAFHFRTMTFPRQLFHHLKEKIKREMFALCNSILNNKNPITIHYMNIFCIPSVTTIQRYTFLSIKIVQRLITHKTNAWSISVEDNRPVSFKTKQGLLACFMTLFHFTHLLVKIAGNMAWCSWVVIKLPSPRQATDQLFLLRHFCLPLYMSTARDLSKHRVPVGHVTDVTYLKSIMKRGKWPK